MVEGTKDCCSPKNKAANGDRLAEEITVRFSGDSGDGMQLVGSQMTDTSAVFGNDVSTLPDFPAEIRAPAGTIAGVSCFQVNFGARRLRTPGDRVHALIAMNPAALKVNIGDVEAGGVVIVNTDAFDEKNLTKGGYDSDPLEDDSLEQYRLFKVPITRLTSEACVDTGLGRNEIAKCKNFFALGLVFWMYRRPMEPTLKWLEEKFAKKPQLVDANSKALKAGYYYGDTSELSTARYTVPPAEISPGTYRRVTGNQALALGLVAAAQRAGKSLFYGSYPITPASDILHELSRLKHFDVRTFQAEDEIAAISSVIGAAFAGAFAVTGTSGPGLSLKGEALGLAVITELPLVLVDVQRAGPSTGIPTRTEQADLNQALSGRHGEAPLCVLAAASPSDCFDMAIEAFRIATQYMTPVILLTDSYLANGAEPWRIPDTKVFPSLEVEHPQDPDRYRPYGRNDQLARDWAIPGTKGLEHRIGGLEKRDGSGEVCYTSENHEQMVRLRAQKIQGIVKSIPPLTLCGDESGRLLVVGWGSTYGAITTAIERCRDRGMPVSSIHLRHINPFPENLGEILDRFDVVVVPELNNGQLVHRIRDEYLVDARSYCKVQAAPFLINEIEAEIERILSEMDR